MTELRKTERIAPEIIVSPVLSARFSSRCRFVQTLSPSAHQVRSHQIQIGQRTGREQPVRVLVQPAVARLHETEYTLDHAEDVLDSGAHLRLQPVLRSLHLIYAILENDSAGWSGREPGAHADESPRSFLCRLGRPIPASRLRAADRAAPSNRPHWPAWPLRRE